MRFNIMFKDYEKRYDMSLGEDGERIFEFDSMCQANKFFKSIGAIGASRSVDEDSYYYIVTGLDNRAINQDNIGDIIDDLDQKLDIQVAKGTLKEGDYVAPNPRDRELKFGITFSDNVESFADRVLRDSKSCAASMPSHYF